LTSPAPCREPLRQSSGSLSGLHFLFTDEQITDEQITDLFSYLKTLK
jgi:hypothetical protein